LQIQKPRERGGDAFLRGGGWCMLYSPSSVFQRVFHHFTLGSIPYYNIALRLYLSRPPWSAIDFFSTRTP
jgi:hypothetical protein